MLVQDLRDRGVSSRRLKTETFCTINSLTQPGIPVYNVLLAMSRLSASWLPDPTFYSWLLRRVGYSPSIENLLTRFDKHDSTGEKRAN